MDRRGAQLGRLAPSDLHRRGSWHIELPSFSDTGTGTGRREFSWLFDNFDHLEEFMPLGLYPPLNHFKRLPSKNQQLSFLFLPAWPAGLYKLASVERLYVGYLTHWYNFFFIFLMRQLLWMEIFKFILRGIDGLRKRFIDRKESNWRK